MENITYREEVKRKLIHLSSLWMVAAILLVPDRIITGIFFSVLFVLTILVERAYVLHVPVITPLYDFFFGKMLRKKPDANAWIVSGGAPVYAAAAVTCFLFSGEYAAVGMAVLLTADVAAALIGRRFGRHRLVNGKSLEGSISFFAVGVLAAFVCGAVIGMPYFVFYALPAVLAATLAELFQKQLKLDDNFLIPVLTAGVLQLTCYFFN